MKKGFIKIKNNKNLTIVPAKKKKPKLSVLFSLFLKIKVNIATVNAKFPR